MCATPCEVLGFRAASMFDAPAQESDETPDLRAAKRNMAQQIQALSLLVRE